MGENVPEGPFKQLYIVLGKEDEKEGVVATYDPTTKIWSPLLTGKTDDSLRRIKLKAQYLADETGKAVRLVKFTNREDLDHFEPRKKP